MISTYRNSKAGVVQRIAVFLIAFLLVLGMLPAQSFAATYYGALRVDIDANGGTYTGTTPLYSVVSGSSTTRSVTASVTLPNASNFTRSGHLFRGFSTSSTATRATYAPGGSYSDTIKCTKTSRNIATNNPNKTTTMYAGCMPCGKKRLFLEHIEMSVGTLMQTVF